MFVWIGTGDHRDARLRLAGIIRPMRHIRGDINEIAGRADDVLFEPLAEMHSRFATENIDRRLVRVVLVRLGATARRDRNDLEMNSFCPCSLGGNTRRTDKPLLA